jgi:hypothetical protein
VLDQYNLLPNRLVRQPGLRIQITLMRIRIQLFIKKVMGICDHWSIDPPGLHFKPQPFIVIVHGPPRFYFETLKLLNCNFNGEPDPGLHSNADPDPALKNNPYPDPASQNNADPDPASKNYADTQPWPKAILGMCMLQGLPTVSRAVIHLEESKTAGEKYKLFVEGDNLRYALFIPNFFLVRKTKRVSSDL